MYKKGFCKSLIFFLRERVCCYKVKEGVGGEVIEVVGSSIIYREKVMRVNKVVYK